MRSVYAVFIFLVLLSLAVPYAYAVPTTTASVAVNATSMTFRATGATNPPIYFMYGTKTGYYPWITENTSNQSGGLVYWKEMGVPLMGGTTFYYKCCDASGCGGELNTALPSVTVAPTTTFNVLAMNLTRSHFDLAVIGVSIIEPYTWVTYNPNITFGILLFFVFIGIWLRQRELIIPILLGMVASGLLLYQGANSVGIPPEMLIIVVGLVAVALTGIVVGLIKR